MIRKRLVFSVLSLSIGIVLSKSARSQAVETPSAPSDPVQCLIKALGGETQPKVLQLKSGNQNYTVVVHAPDLVGRIQGDYSANDLTKLSADFASTLDIPVNHGIVQAANREGPNVGDANDPTHYDAVWLRDSLWVYLGLKSHPRTGDQAKAKTVLTKMLDYVSSPDQLKRFADVIANPAIINGPDGPMRMVHIRFDGKSPTFQDVTINGEPQGWNHKQNDATGLLLDLTLRAIDSGEIPLGQISDAQWKALASFPAYFSQIHFDEMEDAGSWEEIERTNTSSIGLVTSGLEHLQSLLKSNAAFAKKFAETSKILGLSSYSDPKAIDGLVNKGYARVLKQIEAGGESPLYAKESPRYRQADAALLNLIYPARLHLLTLAHKRRVLEILQPLVGEVGIKRYLGDSYQSGNFWFQPPPTSGENRTSDTSSAQDFESRGKQLIAGSEAQWFFDSWYAIAMGKIFQQSHDPADRADEIKHFNRALGQLTGGNAKNRVTGADGKPVPPREPPESYNTLVTGNQRVFAPSPITPLNWAKATLAIMIKELHDH